MSNDIQLTADHVQQLRENNEELVGPPPKGTTEIFDAISPLEIVQ